MAALLVAAAVISAGSACIRPPGGVQATALERFAGCDALLRYVKDAALARVGPYGLGGGGYFYRGGPVPGAVDGSAPPTPPPAATPAQPDASGTNVQEAGVDEPDIVKNDGRRLLTVMGDKLHILDLTAATPRLAGTLALPTGYPQLLLQGDHVLVISTEWGYLPGDPVPPPIPDGGPAIGAPVPIRPGMPYRPTTPRTRLTLVDIADATRPAVLNQLVVDGSFVDARLVGGRARVVTNAGLRPLPFVYPTDGTEAAQRAAQRANEDVIRRSTAADWLPMASTGVAGAPESELLPCDRVAHPPTFSGFDTVAVLSLDLAARQLSTADTVGVTALGQSVYASTANLYVATQATTDLAYAGRLPAVGTRPVPAPTAAPVYEPKTALHAFDVSAAGPATYRASGTVAGAVLNQWSMSEHAGHLRVVTTLGSGCGGCVGEQSQLSVLRLGGADLPVVGTVGGMGKGEAVKAVRFMGDRAYVVTFRQVDPLYVLDLHDPIRPAVAGELKVPGYSAYLHPVGGGQVLGIGRDATPEGRVTGTKIALYDVADPARPTEVRSIVLPDAYTSVEHTAKAFLWWEPQRLAAVPVSSYGKVIGPDGGVVAGGFTGVIGLDVTPGAMSERGRVANEPGPYGPDDILRSAVAGDRLLTVSNTGVRVSDLATLAPRSWVAFPVLISLKSEHGVC